ncbi:MAG TPA: DUF4091 domain-containing protein [Bacteroidales bacterium]|nr:DUF4091 domain-containing protein [Bacteroidales bacterium]HNR41878.1 DUF4091 domain-containing protein [Bacteroidales bacterium]
MKKSSHKRSALNSLAVILAVASLAFQGCKPGFDKDNLMFTYVDPLEKVLAEASYFTEKEAVSDVARGEYATLQFVVRSSYSIKNLRVTVTRATNGTNSLPQAKTGFVGYVRVGRTIWDYSRDRIVSASGYYPDPVLEEEAIDVQFGNARPIWISIPVPADAASGSYTGTVTITGTCNKKNFSVSRDYTVNVYPVTVGTTSLWVTNWFAMDTARLRLLNSGRPVGQYSAEHFELIRKLASKMAEYRQNVAIISPLELSAFSFENGKWKTDFANFDKVVDIFISEGVIGRIEGGHIGGRAGDWNSQFVVMVPNNSDAPANRFDRLPITDQRARDFYQQFLTQLKDHLKEKGWDKFYMQHIADEPTEQNFGSYIQIARFVKSIVPDIPLIEACHSKNLGGILDIWVPQLDFMNADFEFYDKQNKSGKEAWFYTCLSPKGEYANRFIELPLLKTRFIHWLNFKYNIPGYLHWGLNYWNRNPFEEQTSIQYEGGNILPGGDSWIIYPGNGKILSSIRFDAMRDGIADYELLKMLEKKSPEKARYLADIIIYSFDRYDNNIDEFRKNRRKLLEYLSE